MEQTLEKKLAAKLTGWIVFAALVLIPLRIIGYGFLPGDDALRHAAKAVSGKDWSEILVLNPQFPFDHNPGWHWLLTLLHRTAGWGTDALVAFSVVGLALVFSLAPLMFFRRAEAWVAALLVSVVAFPMLYVRMMFGRPYILSVTFLMLVLLGWREIKSGDRRIRRLLLTLAGMALVVWMHGVWYLFVLPVVAFALAGRKREAMELGGCWLGGAVLGGLLTGHAVGYLAQAVRIATSALGGDVNLQMLAYEFHPTEGEFASLAVIGLLMLWRSRRGWRWEQAWRDPIFILVVMGWVLGLKVGRFWYDWGLPSLVVWVALGLQEELEARVAFDSFRRMVLAGLAAVALFFGMTSDVHERWTSALHVEYLTADNAELQGWLPDPGGIIYSTDMGIFYQTFFKNPQAPWRYILGYEPTFMPAEDLQILRRIQWNLGESKAFEPWVAKMRTEDRLVLRGAVYQRPNVAGLEWKYAVGNTWIGRKPRATANAPKSK